MSHSAAWPCRSRRSGWRAGVTVALLIANRSAIHSYADAHLIDAVLPIGLAVIGTRDASPTCDPTPPSTEPNMGRSSSVRA
jgi:hypothetical protein